MIPGSWSPVHRADGERIGYLDDTGAPRTLLGTPLSLGPGEEPRSALAARGLAALDRRWFARLPEDLQADTDAAHPVESWRHRPVVVVEASPASCRIRLALAPPAELRIVLELPVPVGDLLVEEPPAS